MPAPGAAHATLEATLPSPIQHEPSQSLISRAAIGQVVRAAVVGSYGVTGLTDDRLVERLLVRLGLRPPAVVVRLGPGIQVELRILVAAGVPVAEVARQVESAVRYSVRQAIEREIDGLTIHVGGLRFQAAPLPRPLPERLPPSVVLDGGPPTEPGLAKPGSTGSDAA